MAKFYANPYQDAAGFYFETLAQFEAGSAKLAARGIEEVEIDFIDGTKEESDLFKALGGANAGSLESVLDAMDLDTDEQAKLAWLVGDVGYTLPDALRKADDVVLFEGSPQDYIEDYVDQMGGVKALGEDTVNSYFDFDSFGRDLRISGDLTGHLDEEEDADEIARLERMTDQQIGEDFVDSMGGVDALGKNAENYFDYEAFTRDAELNSDITDFKFGGTQYTIGNASSL